ncbi:hypothetical protein GGI25_000846 [Coemansia spiralis]|uniref:BAH domain-containing protein n=1 Tax=Coemansia spiralis TaxID=417178 RepID=A0A9W8G6R2_9FUNG|nr:hypothetical protein GGI25_000846 [Coemansia spiralis]
MSSNNSSTGGSVFSGSEHESETESISNKRQKTMLPSETNGTKSPFANGNSKMLSSVEHNDQVYYIGDHAILEDADDISGVGETGLPAVGHIQSIQKDKDDSTVSITVIWYVHPRLAPHPPYMEFYKNSILRSFRQTTVPIDCIIKKCFVVQPADAMTGHPSEWTEADGEMFVCDSRFVDKGAFIQRIKHWNRGYWPAGMDEGRREILTKMKPWPNGPRELQKSLVPVQPVEEHSPHTPQTRRSTRTAATPNSKDQLLQRQTPASGFGSPPQQQALPQTPTHASSQAQLLAYQQLLSQGQINMPAATSINGQAPPPPFMVSGPNFNPALMTPQQIQMLQHQQQQQQQQNAASIRSPFMQRSASTSNPPAVQAPTSTPYPNPQIPTPRRRGRPPKNKQLIQQRAMEDAAAAAAAAAGGGVGIGGARSTYAKRSSMATPTSSQPRTPTTPTGLQHRQNSIYSNASRLPPSTTMYNGINGVAPNGQRMLSSSAMQMQQTLTPAQLLSAHMQGSNISNGVQANIASALISQQQHQQQTSIQTKTEYLPYADPSSAPQLPKELVDLFPTANERIKWFATAPMVGKTSTNTQHSSTYLEWMQQKQLNKGSTNGCDTAMPASSHASTSP